MMKIAIAFAVLALGSTAVLAADSATDQTSPPAETTKAKRWADCADDLQKFCANIEKGKGKKRECLTQHAADLTPACKTSLDKHAAKSDAPPAPSAN